MPSLAIVALHSGGLVGYGDTFYVPDAVVTCVHELLAPHLLSSAIDLDRFWNDRYRSIARFASGGAELRALSAVDIALWDLAAKGRGVPISGLLAASPRRRVPVYNTCAGIAYARGSAPGEGSGEGSDLDGPDAWWTDPVGVAESVRADGFAGMKIWPFDVFANSSSGESIAPDQLAKEESGYSK